MPILRLLPGLPKRGTAGLSAFLGGMMVVNGGERLLDIDDR